MSSVKQATIDVRNALFEVADGKPFGSVMQGIIMAQTKLAAATSGSDAEGAVREDTWGGGGQNSG